MKFVHSLALAMMGLVACSGQADSQTVVPDRAEISKQDKRISEALNDVVQRGAMKTALVESAEHRISKTFSTGDNIKLEYRIHSDKALKFLWWASVETLRINDTEISSKSPGLTDINSVLKDIYRMDVEVKPCLVSPGKSKCDLYEIIFRGGHRSPPEGHKEDIVCTASITFKDQGPYSQMKCGDFKPYPVRK